MAAFLNGQAYRYTFLFEKANLTETMKSELNEFVTTLQIEEAIYQERGISSCCNIHAYERSLIMDEDGMKITQVYVVVIYGTDWTNLIQTILHFHDTFPPTRIKRTYSYEYSLLDEEKRFEDI